MPEKPHGSILRRAGPLMLARLGVAAFTTALGAVAVALLLVLGPLVAPPVCAWIPQKSPLLMVREAA